MSEMENTVCGVIEGLEGRTVRVRVERKAACEGCQATEVCHALARSSMLFSLPRPAGPLQVGDRAVIALGSASLIKACAIAFMIPVAFIVTALALIRALGFDVDIQTVGALIALIASLLVVRRLGRSIESPRIIEVIHEG